MGSPCMVEFLIAQGNFHENDTQEERCRKEGKLNCVLNNIFWHAIEMCHQLFVFS